MPEPSFLTITIVAVPDDDIPRRASPMPEPAFLTSVREALAILKTAYEEAEAELPEEIKSEHWQKAKGDPAAWESLERKRPGVRALDGLSTITLAASKLEGLVIREEARGRPVDLSLGKHRQR